MIATNVLYVPIVLQAQPIAETVKYLMRFVDTESYEFLNELMFKLNVLVSDQNFVQFEQNVCTIEFEQDVPFTHLPQTLKDLGHEVIGFGIFLVFLRVLSGPDKTNVRRSFFQDGKPIISAQPLIIDGVRKYIVVSQNQCEKRNEQRPFSIRLIEDPKKFNHALYKILVGVK